MPTRISIGSAAIHGAISQMAEAIVARHPAPERLIVLGIANGGLALARRLSARLVALAPKLGVKTGSIDVSFHRDDIGRNPIPKEFTPTIIPGDINGETVILVDDVLFSGRTVKAALDELFDNGRPATVELAVLADRGSRKLPIQANYVGFTLNDVLDSEKVIISLNEQHPAHDQIRVEAGGKKP